MREFCIFQHNYTVYSKNCGETNSPLCVYILVTLLVNTFSTS